MVMFSSCIYSQFYRNINNYCVCHVHIYTQIILCRVYGTLTVCMYIQCTIPIDVLIHLYNTFDLHVSAATDKLRDLITKALKGSLRFLKVNIDNGKIT